MSNQFFNDPYKTPEPNDEPGIEINDQFEKDDPFEDAIPLAAAQIVSPVKETDNQYFNPDPFEDEIPLAAAQIVSPVKETDNQYHNPDLYSDTNLSETTQIEEDVTDESDDLFQNRKRFEDEILREKDDIHEDLEEDVNDDPDDLIQNRNRFEDETPMNSDDIYEDTEEDNVIVIDPINIPVSDELHGFDVPNPGFDTKNSFLDETVPTGILVGNAMNENRPVPSEYSIGEIPNFDFPDDIIDSPQFSLKNPEDSQHFQERWNEIQSKFVDDPKDAVMQADGLISEIIEQIKQRYDNEHDTLKNSWSQSEEFTTEDLRTTLQKYHTLVDQLLV